MTNRLHLLSNRGGMKTYIEDNPHDTENPIVHELNDVTEQLAQAKIVRDDLPAGKDWREVMTIPSFLVNRALREGWFQDSEAWRKIANDPDYAYFRLWRGRV